MIGVMIYDLIVIICFTLLSIYFKHWWIVLFAAFFLLTYKSDRKNVETDDLKEEPKGE